MGYTGQLPTVLSFCSGYGGLEIGLVRAIGRVKVLAHVEIEAFAIANLVNKMEQGFMGAAPIWTDIKTFKAGPFRGCVDIITGGYPCQPFSAAGKRLGDKDPRHLWPHLREHIETIRPTVVFLENVEGHISKGLAEVLADLEEMAYRVECGVFSAAEIGAPHQRKRVFILAHSSSSRPRNNYGQAVCEAGEQILRQGDRQERSVRTDSAGSGEKLGYPPSVRPCGPGPDSREVGTDTEGEKRRVHESEGASSLPGYEPQQKWPARPGEEQYEWEAPRVVADTKQQRPIQPKHTPRHREVLLKNGGDRQDNSEPHVKTKSKLGGATDGVTDRVDRLRLLGNGVVPDTAAKAFITLWRELWITSNLIN